MNKHQAKTKETRELLLQAAQSIFVRDGYAGAELGEIAALAGRTKGAIYAQFKSKEDVFMALVEEHAMRYRAEMAATLAQTTNLAQNREAFRQLCIKIARDKAWNLLMLEFKLFAIRNPMAQCRYQQFLSRMISADDEARLSQVLGVDPDGAHALKRTVGVQLLQPLMSAVALEHLFDPENVRDTIVEQIVSRLFDAIIARPLDLADTQEKASAKQVLTLKKNVSRRTVGK